MSMSPGSFVWYELSTTDTAAAKEFYGAVVGWGMQEAPVPDMAYSLLTAGETPVCGLMELPEDARKMGAPPTWLGYVGVDDVDATTERVRELGGMVHVPPRDIPDIGRFSIVADPQQATFALYRCAVPGPDQPPQPGTPGRVGWHELLAADWENAFEFYSALFAWQKAEAMDMGEMGIYQIFAAGETMLGGMFAKPPVVTTPFWLYYFTVDDINAGARRAAEAGGRITNGPMAVPGGGWIVQATDPQGAPFALFSQRSG